VGRHLFADPQRLFADPGPGPDDVSFHDPNVDEKYYKSHRPDHRSPGDHISCCRRHGRIHTGLIGPEARMADALANDVASGGGDGAFLFHLGDVV